MQDEAYKSNGGKLTLAHLHKVEVKQLFYRRFMCETPSWSDVLQKVTKWLKVPACAQGRALPITSKQKIVKLWEGERLKSTHTLWQTCQNPETVSFPGTLLNSTGLRKPAVKLLSECPTCDDVLLRLIVKTVPLMDVRCPRVRCGKRSVLFWEGLW